MKRILFSIGLVFMFACQSSNPTPTYNSSNVGVMKCTLNGQQWVATSFNNTLLTDYTNNWGVTGKRLDLRGTDDNGKQIILTLASTSNVNSAFLNTGTYTVGGANEALVTVMQGLSLEGMSTGNYSDSCSIVLTSFDATNKTCQGTFEFETSDFSGQNNGQQINYTATNGEFNLFYE